VLIRVRGEGHPPQQSATHRRCERQAINVTFQPSLDLPVMVSLPLFYAPERTGGIRPIQPISTKRLCRKHFDDDPRSPFTALIRLPSSLYRASSTRRSKCNVVRPYCRPWALWSHVCRSIRKMGRHRTNFGLGAS
jgi:hypothetical protein